MNQNANRQIDRDINRDIKKMIATAFAPATVANVAVGFDILGFAVEGVGDTVTAELQSKREVSVIGPPEFPLDPEKNTATAGLVQLIRDLELPHGFRVSIKKGIPVSSGMGGSAASAVAAYSLPMNFWIENFRMSNCFGTRSSAKRWRVAPLHADNVAPCLLGGLVLVKSAEPPDLISLPSPDLFCVLVHPDLKISTRDARQILKPELSLKTTCPVLAPGWLCGGLFQW